MSFFNRVVELWVLLDPAYDRELSHVHTVQESVSNLRHQTRVGRSKIVSDAVATACGEKSLLEGFEPVIDEVLGPFNGRVVKGRFHADFLPGFQVLKGLDSAVDDLANLPHFRSVLQVTFFV